MPKASVPSDYSVVVTKCGHRFPGQDRIAPRHIMLLTPGAGDMRIERLNYVRRSSRRSRRRP